MSKSFNETKNKKKVENKIVCSMEKSRPKKMKGDCLEWIFENDNSVRFRRSGTEPKFKAYFSMYGSTLEKAELNFDQFRREIKEIMKTL